jgi:plasmid stabilization system protein ParE
MATCGFHPEALLEYADATNYYLRRASPRVAEAFIIAVESAIRGVLAAPARWRVVEEPGIRRYVCRRFPYVLYYR